jgi:hypothetical protein
VSVDSQSICNDVVTRLASPRQAIGEAKSKQEEDRIIMEEMAVLKTKMPSQVSAVGGRSVLIVA